MIQQYRNDENYGKKYVICPVCGKKLKAVTHTHTRTHDLTMAEIRDQYPDIPLVCKEASSGWTWNKESRKRVSESRKRKYREDKEFRDKFLEVSQEGREVRWSKPENREARSELSKELWKVPEYRDAVSRGQVEKWRNPEYRKKTIPKIQSSVRELWKDKEYRRKMRDSGRGGSTYAKRCWYTNRYGDKIFLRSIYELQVAFTLDYKAIPYEYEGVELSYLDSKGNTRHYYPDFLFDNRLVELKGIFSKSWYDKFDRVVESNPNVNIEVWSHKEVSEFSVLSYSTACSVHGYSNDIVELSYEKVLSNYKAIPSGV